MRDRGTFDLNSLATDPMLTSLAAGLRRLDQAQIANTAGLSVNPGEGWLIAYGTSRHLGLEFTATGPRALGLPSYAQSPHPASPHFNDQQRRYSDKNMRAIPFSDSEIAAARRPGPGRVQ